MTRLELAIKRVITNSQFDRSSDYRRQLHLISAVKEYLAERDDFVIGTAQTGHNYMSADEARVKLQLEQRGRASQFDNAEVNETSDEAEEAFDDMFADSLGALAKL